MSSSWKHNSLFRLLVFLDIVGLQSFSAKSDITPDGKFVDVGRSFGAGRVVHDILSCGIHAFRANITRLFTDEEERAEVLRLVGSSEDPSSVVSQCILTPPSLTAFVDAVESDLPLWVIVRIREAFGLTGTVTPLMEQFLIDALDHWMSQRKDSENDALVLACGVQPAVLESARGRGDELPHAIEDFIIDVVFPPSLHAPQEQDQKASDEMEKDDVLDWIIASYERCYETIDVDNEGEEDVGESPEKKLRVEEKDDDDGDDDEFLTAENLNRFMRERPSAVPKSVLRELRRPLDDSAITEFELQNHYTAGELLVFVKDVLGERRRLKKAACVKAIVKHHRSVSAAVKEVKEQKKVKGE